MCSSCRSGRGKKVCAVVTALVIVGTALVIVMVLSFSGVEYNQYGFRRARSAGTVYKDKVYTGGKYFLGPNEDFLLYQADAHYETLRNIDVFTRDKLEVEVTIHFQYFLRKDELVSLLEEFNVYYHNVIYSSAEDAVKGAIPVYTTRELFSNRREVENELHKAVLQRVGGICCRPNCTQYEGACLEDCTPVSSCQPGDMGLHADVIYFQLTRISIPGTVRSQFLQALTLQENALREVLKQEAKLVRTETTAKVKDIKNQATEITQNATAEANLIRSQAFSDQLRIKENARITGLKRFCARMNITDEEFMRSYEYMRTMLNKKNKKLTIDFHQRIAGSLK